MYRWYQSSTGGRIVSRRLPCVMTSNPAGDAISVENPAVILLDRLEPVEIQSQTLMRERASSPRFSNAKGSSGFNRSPRHAVTPGYDKAQNTPMTATSEKANEGIPDQSQVYSPRRGAKKTVVQKLMGRCTGRPELSVVVAMGHWTDTFGSHEANSVVVESLLQASVTDIFCVPVSSGGRGWLNSFRSLLDHDPSTEVISVDVRHPMSKNVMLSVPVVLAKNSKAAAIEGDALIGPQLLNGRSPLSGTSYGVGQAIREVAEMGVKTIYLGLGHESACLDCGAGMAQALGVEFFDSENNLLPNTSNVCGSAAYMNITGIDPVISDCRIIVGYESQIPLLGQHNILSVTGMDSTTKEEMTLKVNTSASMEGSGAGGGIGYMLSVLMVCDMRPGLSVVLEASNMEKRIRSADVLLTGQTVVNPNSDDIPIQLSKLARRCGTHAILFTGQSNPPQSQALDVGIDCIVPIPQGHELADDADIRESLSVQVARNIRLLQIGETL